jgi:hypothetical protein
MSNAATNISEYASISNVVQHYIDSAKSGNGKVMKSVFHSEATIFGHAGADHFAGPIQQFFSWHANNGPATELQARIVCIDIVNTVATVRLELENWTGHRFTDLFTLLKTNDTWHVTNKVFHLHD